MGTFQKNFFVRSSRKTSKSVSRMILYEKNEYINGKQGGICGEFMGNHIGVYILGIDGEM